MRYRIPGEDVRQAMASEEQINEELRFLFNLRAAGDLWEEQVKRATRRRVKRTRRAERRASGD